MQIINTRLRQRAGLYDVTIEGGRFTNIYASPEVRNDVAPGTDQFDAEGKLLSPPFVDAHLHLDFANTVGQPRLNESGTLFEAIGIWADHKALGYVTPERVKANALDAIRREVGNGVGFIRTHVDTTDPDLVALDALLEIKDEVREWCEIQIISFPQNGVYAFPRGDELLEESLRRGADVIGGIPHFERSREAGVRSLNWIFDLAERYEAMIDVHCDEIDDEQSRFLEVMAEQTVERGLAGRVTASHVVAMSHYRAGYLAKLMPKLVEADMRFAINPTENLHLQGWGTDAPMPRGVAPIRALTEAGLNVAMGQDSIADPWYPIGDGDLLRVLESGMHVGHLLNEHYLARCLDFITVNGAKNMGIESDYGVEVGKPAHAILLDADGDKDALWRHADIIANIHAGEFVFEREPRRYRQAIPAFLGK